MTLTLSAMPWAAKAWLKLSTILELSEALQPVPPQQRISMCGVPLFSPEALSSTDELAASLTERAFRASLLMLSSASAERIFIVAMWFSLIVLQDTK